MTVATGFRPRPWEAHVRLAQALARAPARVAVRHADDGWLCAQLRMAGRTPVWGSSTDPRPAARALLRLGLGRLDVGRAETWIGADGRLHQPGRRGLAPLPPQVAPRVGVVVTTVGPWPWTREVLRHLVQRGFAGKAVVVDRSGDPAVWPLVERAPRIRAFRRPGASRAEAVATALANLDEERVLILPEDALPLPGIAHVLAHALDRRAGCRLAVGDVIELDGLAHRVQGVDLAPRLDPVDGPEGLLARLPHLPPVLVHRDPERPLDRDEGALAELAWLLHHAADTAVVPLFTAVRRADDGLRPDGERRPVPVQPLDPPPLGSLVLEPAEVDLARLEALVRLGEHDAAREALRARRGPPSAREARLRQRLDLLARLPDAGPARIVVDDGDVGALEATLARLPDTGELHVLRAVPDAAPRPATRWPGHWGGYGEKGALPVDVPWRLHLTSDPAWASPVLQRPDWLPPLPAPDAVRLLAVALGWPLPHPRRRVPGAEIHPVARLALDVRASLDRGERHLARTLVRALAEALPGWPPLEGLRHSIEIASGATGPGPG